jgi:hypothetical protein
VTLNLNDVIFKYISIESKNSELQENIKTIENYINNQLKHTSSSTRDRVTIKILDELEDTLKTLDHEQNLLIDNTGQRNKSPQTSRSKVKMNEHAGDYLKKIGELKEFFIKILAKKLKLALSDSKQSNDNLSKILNISFYASLIKWREDFGNLFNTYPNGDFKDQLQIYMNDLNSRLEKMSKQMEQQTLGQTSVQTNNKYQYQ